MKQRVIAAVAGILITVPLIIWGGLPLAFFGSLISVFAALEMAALLKKMGLDVRDVVVTSSSFLFVSAPAWFGEAGTVIALLFMIVILVISMLLKRMPLDSVAANVFIPLYSGFFLGRLIMLREIPTHGLYLTFLVLFVVWASDIFAYLVGKRFGRIKLAPAISPNKTVEGSIAGILGGVLVASVAYLFYRELIVETAVIALVAGVMTQFGDLFESQFKRWAGVKDSGSLIPGHGGILDRIDGLVFAAAASYYIALLFMSGT